MKYTIEYFDEVVQKDIDALPIGFRARYTALTSRMVEYGANLGAPHTAPMGNGLFEMRLKSQEGIARVFYGALIDKRIVMLHSFIKKTQKTPLRELNIAQTRLKEIKNAHP